MSNRKGAIQWLASQQEGLCVSSSYCFCGLKLNLSALKLNFSPATLYRLSDIFFILLFHHVHFQLSVTTWGKKQQTNNSSIFCSFVVKAFKTLDAVRLSQIFLRTVYRIWHISHWQLNSVSAKWCHTTAPCALLQCVGEYKALQARCTL